ncbi:protein hold'em [Aphis craccivora]|uniref:Protein hold'em n=1 Tax=Aphis craccivora TaxID=307492 RepID=A0A6G0VL10_APHCR|nr:protein hold'em [Aphis craccivora]
MSLNQRTELKWKYLFTNCMIKLVVTEARLNEKLTILIVDIENEGPISKFISRVPIY